MPTTRRRSSRPACGRGSRRRRPRSGWRRATAASPPSRRSTRPAQSRCAATQATGKRRSKCRCPHRPSARRTGSGTAGRAWCCSWGIAAESNSGRGRPAPEFAAHAQWSCEAGPSAYRGDVRFARASRHRLAGRSGHAAHRGGRDACARRIDGGGRQNRRGTRRGGVGVPRVPAAGRVARRGRRRQAQVVRRPAVLGSTDSGLGVGDARGW